MFTEYTKEEIESTQAFLKSAGIKNTDETFSDTREEKHSQDENNSDQFSYDMEGESLW
jgi:hypothetical protein